jgi:hypothetical protein
MRFSKKQTASKLATTDIVPATARSESPAGDMPDELVAARAYEKWQQRGCPMGQDPTQDWFAAREELEQERLSWAPPRGDDRSR